MAALGAVPYAAQTHSVDEERDRTAAEAIMDLCPRGQGLARCRNDNAAQDSAQHRPRRPTTPFPRPPPPSSPFPGVNAQFHSYATTAEDNRSST